MSDPSDKRKYRVLINGENFLLNIDGRVQRMGFYTTRFVEAKDAEQAEAIAVELIKRDTKLSETVLNKRGDSPMLHAEEVEEVEESGAQLGYAFYSEEESAQ
ncbi:MAG TPA: hypothetical protein VJ843_00535 [Candidatus Saccharimonadales bacterium]|nr:hypothetical protein [Candidatus Saccharimonadales bacterium]